MSVIWLIACGKLCITVLIGVYMDFKHTDYDYQKSWDKLHDIMLEHNIDVDDLMD
jgi:hypothetical protein